MYTDEDFVVVSVDELTLSSSLEMLEGIGPKRAALLGNLGIFTVGDLVYHLPRDYQDRRDITRMADAEEGALVTVEGEVLAARNVRMRGRMSMAVVTIGDESGRMTATFFGRGFLAQTVFKEGVRGFFTGTVGTYKGRALKNPEYELIGEGDEDLLNTGCIVPIYRLTEKVTQRMLRKWIQTALGAVENLLEERLPADLVARDAWPPVSEAMRSVHYPETLEVAALARRRFAYEELLGMQVGLLRRRATRLEDEQGHEHTINGPTLKALGRTLPFALTTSQDRVISEILGDMASARPMLRLVQGDVGCGKTVVALHAIAAAVDGGYQVALMVPTELLAFQHAAHLGAMLAPLSIRVACLTGSRRDGASIRSAIGEGHTQVVVGTHALIQEATEFERLGLVIVDEQHRFGVSQRNKLSGKGVDPDILHLTATPIPRSLAMTFYGAMDISVIDELPPGRIPIKTTRVEACDVESVYAHICAEASQGHQTYFVCPLIDVSESREDLRSVIEHYEELSAGAFSGLRTALLHGRLEGSEKGAVLERFKAGEIDVLFSTTVIEVGLDVARATTMVIENASQFGVTQLHQLRGRIGRGTAQSYCFLLGDTRTPEGGRRLEILCEHSSGFDIAEADLLLRGPGEFFGVRQAGLTDFRVADLVRDVRLLEQAQRDARAILRGDPGLADPVHAGLRASVFEAGAIAH